MAFTRAEECLYAFAPPKGSKNGYPLNSVANALCQSFTVPDQATDTIALCDFFDEDQNVLELGAAPQTQRAPAEQKTFSLVSYPSVRWRDRLMVRPTSHGYFNATANDALTVNLATLLKELLIRTEHANDLERHLQDLYYERGITLAERERLWDRTQAALAHPTLRDWYEFSGSIKIQRTLLMGNHRYVCPDRVLTDSSQATIVHFGLSNEQSAHTRVIRQSSAVLQQLGHLSVAGFWVNVQEIAVVEIQ